MADGKGANEQLTDVIANLELTDEQLKRLIAYPKPLLKTELGYIVDPPQKQVMFEVLWPRRTVEYIRQKYGVSIYGRIPDGILLTNTQKLYICVYLLQEVLGVRSKDFIKHRWGCKELFRRSITFVSDFKKTPANFNFIADLVDQVCRDLKK